jgi:cyclophilin family peptidyl-prolyl cis-trans isomerase
MEARRDVGKAPPDELERPEDTIPDLPENQRAREFLKSAPSKGLWMPLGQSVKVMQCFRCKANGHANGGYGHRTGDRECPYFLSGNAANEEMRRRHEDPMAGQLSSDQTGSAKPQIGSADEVRSLLAQIKEVEKLKKRKRRRDHKKQKHKKKKRKRHKEKHKKHKRHQEQSDSSSSGSDSASDSKDEGDRRRAPEPAVAVAAAATAAEAAATGSDSDVDASPSGNPVVVFDTSEGALSVEVFLDKVPLTASSFLDLVERGFYNGLHFHRVIEGFVLQFGCPYSRDPMSQKAGTGAPEPGSSFTVRGGTRKGSTVARDGTGMIRDEHVWRKRNSVGTLSMANTGEPHSGGSQFFINLAANSFLDWFNAETAASHVVFGRVLLGKEIVEKIAHAETRDDDRPVRPIQVRRASYKPIPSG